MFAAVVLMLAAPVFAVARAPRLPNVPYDCLGDCAGVGEVTVAGIIVMVNIALGNTAASACANGDADGSGTITIDEITHALNNVLFRP